MVVSLIIGVFLLGCEDVTQQENLTVALEYQHNTSRKYQKEYSEVNFHRHNIIVNPNVVDIDLDSNMSARVNVPLDVNLTVDYKNYTTTYPDTYYEYGSSDPFIVSRYSPNSLTIGILVSVNPNYPVEEAEPIDNTTIDNETIDNETIDNETIDNETIIDNITIDNVTYTDNITWSDNFTYNVAPTQEQKIRWIEFLDNMSNDNWSSISIGNPDNMTTCDNATLINSVIAESEDNSSYELIKQSCNGMYWNWAICWNTREIGAYSTPKIDCKCINSGYTLRPGFHNRNWGGVGKSCYSDNQTLQMILKK